MYEVNISSHYYDLKDHRKTERKVRKRNTIGKNDKLVFEHNVKNHTYLDSSKRDMRIQCVQSWDVDKFEEVKKV